MKNLRWLTVSLCALLSHLILPAQIISTGVHNGASFSNNTSVGTIAWGNMPNAAASDNSTASAGATVSLFSTARTNYLIVRNFNFSIPANSSICGIQVDIECRRTGVAIGSSITDNSVRIVKNGNITGSSLSPGGAWATSDTYRTYGSNSSLWGATWMPADLNATDFGVAISASLNAGLAGLFLTAHIDHVRITVFYELLVLLPVTLERFTVAPQKNDDGMELSWTALPASEPCTFVPERSGIDQSWQALGSIPSADNTSRYSFTDTKPEAGINYYRIAIKSAIGKTTYSVICKVNHAPANQVTVYPNPAVDRINISGKNDLEQIVLRDLQGRAVRYVTNIRSRKYEMPLNGLKQGMYLLEVDRIVLKVLVK